MELQFAAEKTVAAGKLARLQGAFDEQSDLLDVDRTAEILVDCGLLDDVLHAAQRIGFPDENSYDVRVYDAKLAQQRHTIRIMEQFLAYHEIDMGFPGDFNGGFRG
jgi:hypothetical protein